MPGVTKTIWGLLTLGGERGRFRIDNAFNESLFLNSRSNSFTNKNLTKTRRQVWVTTHWLRVQMCCIQVKMWSFTIKLLWYSVLFSQAYEKATKEQRMRTEISQAKREVNFYIQNVEKGKAIDAIETRKRKRDDQVWCLSVLSLFKKIKNERRESTHTHYVICWVVAYMAWHCSPRRLERRWWWWCHGDKALIDLF